MKNTLGKILTVTLFGESHGSAIGAVIDGMPSGIEVDEYNIRRKLSLRRPQNTLSTARREPDRFTIESGVYLGKTTGTPICILIPNSDTRSADYSEIEHKCRPSHADYTALCRFGGFADPRGGGHFSGRITAALVAAGAIVEAALIKKGIKIVTHIKEIYGIADRDFADIIADAKLIENEYFAVLDSDAGEKMKREILAAREKGDSVGGVLETAVLGLPAGVGEPWFDTVEGLLSKAVFSVPAVKGIEFGGGFGLAKMRGSEANDPMHYEGARVVCDSNNSGGINGGITNGMPLLFRTAIKPTPTIGREQNTVDTAREENTVLAAKGRHDPCIVHRARAVIDSVAAFTVLDLLLEKYGSEWFLK